MAFINYAGTTMTDIICWNAQLRTSH